MIIHFWSYTAGGRGGGYGGGRADSEHVRCVQIVMDPEHPDGGREGGGAWSVTYINLNQDIR